MIKKIHLWCMLLFVCLAVASCGSDTFEVEGALPDVGDMYVRAVYVNEQGVQEATAQVEKGRFTIEGVAPNYTVVNIFNKENKLLTRAVMKNGDRLKMRGTVKHSNLIEMKGSDVNEEWCNFRRDNHALYEEEKAAILDKKIEEYIEANGDKMSSLMLLLYDYSALDSTKRVHDLLNKISEEVRPASLMKAYTEMNAMLVSKKEQKKKFHSMAFFNENDSIEMFVPLRSKLSVMCFWSPDDNSRKDVLEELDSLYYDFKGKKQLQLVDINVDSDATRWKRVIKKEDKEWKHYFAVGGMMNRTIKDLQIVSTPEFIVLDSIGQPLYRGDSIGAVSRIVREKLKKTSTKNKNTK